MVGLRALGLGALCSALILCLSFSSVEGSDTEILAQELKAKKAAVHHLSATLQKSVHVTHEEDSQPATQYSNWPGARSETHVHHKAKHSSVLSDQQQLAAAKKVKEQGLKAEAAKAKAESEKAKQAQVNVKSAAPSKAEVKQDKAQAEGVKAEQKAIKAEAAVPSAKGLKENVKKAVKTSGNGVAGAKSAKGEAAKPVQQAMATKVARAAEGQKAEGQKADEQKDPRLEYSHKKDHRLGFSKFSWLFKDTEKDMRDEKPRVHSAGHAKQIALQGGENATDDSGDAAPADSEDTTTTESSGDGNSTEGVKAEEKGSSKATTADDLMVSKDREMYFIVTLLVSIVVVTLMGLCCIKYARTILGADNGERPPVGAAGATKGVRGYGTVGRAP